MPSIIIENGVDGTLLLESIPIMKMHYCIYMKKIGNRILHEDVLKGGDDL